MLKIYFLGTLLLSALELGRFAQHHNAPQFNHKRSVYKGGHKSFMTCFTLYNREHEPIDNAEFFLNGERLEFRSGYGFCTDGLSASPYHLIIRHPDYLEAEYSNLKQLGGQLYMLREGEDYYYEQSIKRPLLHRRDVLLVIAAHRDAAGQYLDPVNIREQLKLLLAANDLKIVTNYGDLLKENRFFEEGGGDIHQDYTYLVGRKDGRSFSEVAAELKALRSSSIVESAGPALMMFESTAIPRAYGSSIRALFTQDIPEQDVLNRLSKAGYADVQSGHSGSLRSYSVQLPLETGMSMNMHVERIAAIDGVVESEPEIILYE